MDNLLIDICNVSKHYLQPNSELYYALNNINLSIYKGEIIALLGANGAGKTTLSSILATVHPVSTGTITWNNNSIYKNIIAYRKAIGFCPQWQNLDMLLSVKNNLVFAGKYFLLRRDEIQKRTDELLEFFKLTYVQNAHVQTLSGGTKQRLLLARALMHRPEIIILDEPTAGLDPHIRRSLWQLIKNLKELGLTIVLTTHYLDEAEYLADRICILNKGTVQLIAPLSELQASHNMARLEDIFLSMSAEESE